MSTGKKKQFIVDDRGKPVAIVLDIRTYNKMEEALDDYYCRKEYDRTKRPTDAEIRSGKALTIEEYVEKRKPKHRRATA